MPVKSGVSVEVGNGKVFEPVPADVYTVEVLDIEEREGTKYQSSEVETQINFKFVIIEEGPFYGRFMWATCAPKITVGTKQSKLYQVIVAATAKEFSKDELKRAGEIVTPEFLNGIIGSQLRLTVSVKDKVDGSGGKTNKIDSFLPKKVELPKFDAAKVQLEKPV